MDKDKVSKRWPPIENNPEVLNELAHKLGMTDSLEFHDVYSLTDKDLLAFLPRPVMALVLVFPVTQAYERARVRVDAAMSQREEEEGRDDASAGSTPDGDPTAVVWYKQTIGNACGTMALLHTLSNLPPGHISQDSKFYAVLQRLKSQSAAQRVETIEGSDLIDGAHQSVASQGQSDTIPAAAKVNLHFIAFVKVCSSSTRDGADDTDGDGSGVLYELDGRRPGPISHGALGADEDVLDRGLQVIQDIVASASGQGDGDGDGDDDGDGDGDGQESDSESDPALNFSVCALA